MISGCLTFCLIFGILLSPFFFLADVIMGKELRFDWISTPIIVIMSIFYICVFYAVFFGKNSNNGYNNNNEYKDNYNDINSSDNNNKNGTNTKKNKKAYKAKNDNSFIE